MALVPTVVPCRQESSVLHQLWQRQVDLFCRDFEGIKEPFGKIFRCRWTLRNGDLSLLIHNHTVSESSSGIDSAKILHFPPSNLSRRDSVAPRCVRGGTNYAKLEEKANPKEW